MNGRLSIRLTGRIQALLVVALLALLPQAAFGLTSYYGADYSYDSGGIKTMVACDNTADGDVAYANYRVSAGWSGNVYDQAGGTPSCAWQNTGSIIVQHRTCRDRLGGDNCGGFVYPSPGPIYPSPELDTSVRSD